MSARSAALRLSSPSSRVAPISALSSEAFAAARSALREPIRTRWPAWAQRSASPLPSAPAPPITAITGASGMGELGRRGLDDRAQGRRGERGALALGRDRLVERVALLRRAPD